MWGRERVIFEIYKEVGKGGGDGGGWGIVSKDQKTNLEKGKMSRRGGK